MDADADASSRDDGDDRDDRHGHGRSVPGPAPHRSREERLYEAHVMAVYGYLARRVGPRTGEALTAEVFLVAFGADEAFCPPPDSERARLFAIALEVLQRRERGGGRRWLAPFRRRPRVRPTRAEPVGATGGRPRSPLAVALDALPAVECEVLLLHVWAELSDRDIAAVLGISTETVHARLAWARARLVHALRGLSPPPPAGLA